MRDDAGDDYVLAGEAGSDGVRTRMRNPIATIVGVLMFLVTNSFSEQKPEEPELVDRGAVSYPLKGHIALTNVGKPVRGMLVECFVHGWKKRVAMTKRIRQETSHFLTCVKVSTT